jgi:hypothetical protein
MPYVSKLQIPADFHRNAWLALPEYAANQEILLIFSFRFFILGYMNKLN